MIAAGHTIGNYRILNKIGTGGMGAVYLAEHPLIGKRVALKVIHRELAGNRDVVSRFFQEARAVNKIGNEHIVEIHDFGATPEGDYFFIMEYLEGKTLASILSRETALDIMRSLHIAAQIASALAAAHVAGIVHRDLKPDNIMLMTRMGDHDFVKVLDFGLAKVFSAATAVKTAAGVLLGTPQYMSPEACESKGDVDHRTDIYALGVLLFQMMTGVLPFDGDSMGEVLVKQVTMLPPAPRAINPAIPPSVEQILLRCLAKPVDARFATMMELREALLDPEAYLHGSPPIAPARSVRSDDGIGEASTLALAIGPPQTTRLAAAAQQPTRLAASPAAHQKTRLATSNPLPLPAPAPSMTGAHAAPTVIAGAPPPPRESASLKRPTVGMPALAQPSEPKMNTMRIATPLGYTSRAPRKVWPVVLVMALLLGFGGGALSVWLGGSNTAKPASSDGSSAKDGSGADLASTAPGDRSATNSTPNAGGPTPNAGAGGPTPNAGAGGPTPNAGAGASTPNAGAAAAASTPNAGAGASTPNAGGPTPNAGAGGPTPNAGAGGPTPNAGAGGPTSNAGAGGPTPNAGAGGPTPNAGAGASTPNAGAGASTPNAGAGGPTPNAGGPTPNAGGPKPNTGTEARPPTIPTAHLSIDSAPRGAAVTGPNGEVLGKTPVKLDWPISDAPVRFELRLAGYKRKTTQTVVNGNTALRIELERAVAVRRNPPGPGSGQGSGSARPGTGDNALMRPDD